MTPDQFSKKLNGSVGRTKIQAMRGATGALLKEVLRSTPRRSGSLQQHWTLRVEDGGNRGVLSNDSSYARPALLGSKPHVIRARNAKVLRFAVGGGVMFAKEVNHPGTRPNAAFIAAPNASLSAIERELSVYGKSLLVEIVV